MNAAALTPLLVLLTLGAWGSFAVLSWAAFNGSRIGALTERTSIAFIIALLGTISCVLRFNTDTGFSLFPQHVAAFIFATTMLVVLAIPTGWLVLWFSGRLGEQNVDRDATMRRIEEALTENTRISQGARDDAHEAAEAANSVNEKIARAERNIEAQGTERDADRLVAGTTAAEVHDLHTGIAPEKAP